MKNLNKIQDINFIPDNIDKEGLNKELTFIKHKIDTINNRARFKIFFIFIIFARELKTDHELANDVRYYNKHFDFLLKRIESKNYYQRLGMSQ